MTWNASLYENKHSFVWQYGENLLEILSPQKGDRILDLGCGTGHLTDRIAKMGATAIGIDNSPAMIAQAKQNYPDVQFEIADGTNFTFSESFDAVFSNAVLHWIKPPEAVINCIWKVLKPGGRFIAEFGGKGNVREIVDAIASTFKENDELNQLAANSWYFPSIGEYASLLEKQGFEVNNAMLFDRPTPLDGEEEGMRNWLEMFAQGIFSDISSDKKEEILCKIEEKLRPKLHQNNTWFADYRRIRIVAKKV
ncbi:methyltransferase domain-containing protein [Candidatus Gracilibacteria bacterium]|nr:methyltransferase domain-containing protein [Candidatus Gracilibacteria bacterium]NJM88243.1 methyltransferase domain-containing protein [Hydrococcus sp. RU_2_2]NJP18141.1 methyltransferase domain-containing protein [Hydrococcus sp. CRU_1_1]